MVRVLKGELYQCYGVFYYKISLLFRVYQHDNDWHRMWATVTKPLVVAQETGVAAQAEILMLGPASRD